MKENFFGKGSSEFDRLKDRLSAALKGIREELDDHRQSIDQNTEEVGGSHGYMRKMDEKLDRTIRRVEQMESVMFRIAGVPLAEEKDQRPDLTEREKRIFLIIYTAPEPVTYGSVSKALGENEFIVRGYVTNMMEKGIPVRKDYRERQVYLSLDREFRERQAKHNVAGISQTTVKEFLG